MSESCVSVNCVCESSWEEEAGGAGGGKQEEKAEVHNQNKNRPPHKDVEN